MLFPYLGPSRLEGSLKICMEQIQVGELSEYLCGGNLFHIQQKTGKKKKKEERTKPALTIRDSFREKRV